MSVPWYLAAQILEQGRLLPQRAAPGTVGALAPLPKPRSGTGRNLLGLSKERVKACSGVKNSQ